MGQLQEELKKWQRELQQFLRIRHYVLDENRQAIPCEDFLEAAEWFESADRQVALTTLSGDAFVSTVFLGLDHNHGGIGPPLLFETAVFRGQKAEIMMRYSTWAQAEEGHKQIVKHMCEIEDRQVTGGDPLDAEFIDEIQ
jgi:hypothetical protein